MARRRWTCDCGNNLLAPERLRKDDVRRYCLPCSENTGRLVERRCPAQERAREHRKAKRTEKAKRQQARQRERDAHITAAMKARDRACRMGVWQNEGLVMRPEWLEIRDGKVGRGRAGRTGYAVAGRESTPEWNALVVVHELVHICLYRRRHVTGWRGHGQAFRGLYLSACVEFFGVDPEEVLQRWQDIRGLRTGRIKAYDLDAAVYQVMVGMEEPKHLYRSDVTLTP